METFSQITNFFDEKPQKFDENIFLQSYNHFLVSEINEKPILENNNCQKIKVKIIVIFTIKL